MNSPSASAEFATDVVHRLQRAGFVALWAGGCVRDQLLGRVPKDYDVATDATPDQVQQLFGHRRTLSIGVSFGVITVLGPRSVDPIEVATFRRDEGYSDGRRPDKVHYCSAEEDARRRDFTINGLFFDPTTQQVIDYVDGRADLQQRLVRCIGNPHERIREDKLRMLRAIRFAGTLDFEIDPVTFQAVCDHADDLHVVSAERIAAEMRRVLIHCHTLESLVQLRQTGLWRTVLPEYAGLANEQREAAWQELLALFRQLETPRPLSVALAAVVRPIVRLTSTQALDALANRWKLSNRERAEGRWLLQHIDIISEANRVAWPRLQPLLTHDQIESLLTLAQAELVARHGSQTDVAGIEHCRKQLSLPPEQLNPEPLVDGHDLMQAGIPTGKQIGQLLVDIRAEQLEGRLIDSAAAIQWAKARILET